MMTAVACATLVLGFVTAVSADAMVPQPGQFMASECGFQIPPYNPGTAALEDVEMNKLVAVSKVCIGQIAGAENEPAALAVSFELASGQLETFKVARTTDDFVFLTSGLSKSTYFLATADNKLFAMHIVRSFDHQIVRTSGRVGQMDYITSAFVPVLIVQ